MASESPTTTAPNAPWMNGAPGATGATAPAAPASAAAPAVAPAPTPAPPAQPAAAPVVMPARRPVARPPVRPVQRVTQKPSPESMFEREPEAATQSSLGPFRILCYGVEGVGKTRLGAAAPKPIFITPRGTFGDLKPKPKAWHPTGWANDWTEEDGVMSAGVLTLIRYLTTTDLPYQTLVIDELDTIESYAIAHVLKVAKAAGINEGPLSYGVGYDALRLEWLAFTAAIDELRRVKKMNVVLLAHADNKKFANPEGADYDRYHFRLSKKGADVLFSYSDVVLFANYRTLVQLASKKATKGKGISDGRVMYTTRNAAWDAKNRYSLPPSMALSWDELWKALHPTPEDVATKCLALRGQILHSSAQLGDEEKYKAVETWLEKVGDNTHKLELCLNNLTAKLAALAETEAAQESGETA